MLLPLSRRIRAIVSVRMLVASAVVGFAGISGVAWAQSWPLLQSSFLLEEWRTLFSVLAGAPLDFLGDLHTAPLAAGMLLLAVNALLMLSVFQKKRSALTFVGPASVGFGGLITFIFGLGCLSCGAALAAFSASVIGVSAFPALAAWGSTGAWVGVAFLGALTIVLAKAASDPLVC